MAKASRPEPFGRVALHLLILSCFAVAEPLLEVLKQNPEFLVAHRLTPIDLAVLPLLLAILPAAALAVLVLTARRLGPRTGRLACAAAVSALAALVALQAIRRLGGWPWPAAFGFAAVAGGAIGALYDRAAGVRAFVTWLWPGLLLFPAAFLLAGPVRPFVVPHDRTRGVETPTPPDTPIVMVVFDQFPLASLLDGQGHINAARYPAFSALASGATWYRRATTGADLTGWAIPAIVTGSFPSPDRSPTAQEYPDNLFALLGSAYTFDVVEPITKLCPERLCGSDREAAPARYAGMLADLGVVYLHMVLPADLEHRLPSLTENWRDFFAAATWKDRWVHARDEDRRASARAFIDSIDGSRPARTLYFLHVLLPHEPYIYLPSGQEVEPDPPMTGLRQTGRWTEHPWPVQQNFRRHLLQAGYTDALLGRLVARLKAVGLYDRALLVVTADHGVAFDPGEPFKGVRPSTAAEILPVPLFIKAPGQREGVVSARPVESIDVLPTVAAMLGVEPTWKPDGVSALDASVPPRTEKVAYCDGATRRFTIPVGELDARLAAVVRRKIAWVGLDSADRHLLTGPHTELLGRAVDDVPQEPLDAELDVTLDGASRFADVDPTGDPFPSWLTGRVTAGRSVDRLPLAVAVNGTICATTWAAPPVEGSVLKWAALIVPARFKKGMNEVEVFVIGDGTPPVLQPAVRTAGRIGEVNLALPAAHDMWNVAQHGLYDLETLGVSGEYRWTDGAATISTRIDPARPPRSLRAGILMTAPHGSSIALRVGDCTLFEGQLSAGPWYRTFSLDGCHLSGGTATISLTSSTFVPGGNDQRTLGVGLAALNLFSTPWPLPPADLTAGRPRYRMTFSPDTHETVTATEARLALLRVTNQGDEAWPSAADPGDPSGAVNVVVRWFRAGASGAPVAEDVASLPRAVYPGDTAIVRVPIVPASTPLAPGEYDLRVSLRQGARGDFPPPPAPVQMRVTVQR
jgi:hypothetical protein